MSRSDWVINAGRLVDIFTSMEYTIGQAVCDLIDNAVDADATEVEVLFGWVLETGKRYLIVADNGRGIPVKDIDASMSLGAAGIYNQASLGKFGIGLKLSSLSQAEEVTLFSRDPVTHDLGCRRVSANHIRNTGRLELLHSFNESEYAHDAQQMIEQGGTAVLWEELDKFPLAFGRKSVRASHSKAVTVLQEYVSLVFHRYLAGEVSGRAPLVVRVNNKQLTPLEPMARDLAGGQYGTLIRDEKIAISAGDGSQVSIPVTLVILPHRSRMKSSDLLSRMLNVCSANEAQGMYFYRNDRLIEFGGWECLSRTSDEHTKLAKVVVDVPIALDKEFRLNPTKTAYVPPLEFTEALTELLAKKVRWVASDSKDWPFTVKAKKRYGNEGTKPKTRRKKAKPAAPAPVSPAPPAAGPSPVLFGGSGSNGGTGAYTPINQPSPPVTTGSSPGEYQSGSVPSGGSDEASEAPPIPPVAPTNGLEVKRVPDGGLISVERCGETIVVCFNDKHSLFPSLRAKTLEVLEREP